MGIFRKNVVVRGRSESAVDIVPALVDTGATYSMLPSSLMSEMGVEASKYDTFTLADGRKQRFPTGEVRLGVWFERDGWNSFVERYSPVIFGPDDCFLLGAITLQIFGLIADTTNHKVIPAPEMTL
jgi:hypothetical protein